MIAITKWARSIASAVRRVIARAARRIADRLINQSIKRPPDFIIGGTDDPYLLRWWLVPRNKVFNVYLHCFFRSDDDRALHDHPWSNCSVLLRGQYREHTIAAGGVHRHELLKEGAVRLRLFGSLAHRVELVDGFCWTLFITGPRYREWGFHCPEEGWIHWERFTADDDKGAAGTGCQS